MFAVLAVLICGAFGGFAEAKVRKFDNFSIDVPEGWKVNEDKENLTVSFIAPDESAAMTISIFENEGESLEYYAKAFEKELGGNSLKKAGPGYIFLFENENGVACRGLVSAANDEQLIMLMTAIGEHADFDKMVDSLQ
jgi:hypothetical protein